MEASTSRVIGTAALISVGVGTINSFAKYKRPPSMRFLIGSGAAYVILSAIGEAEPEVAKALAIAVATTVVIGDGGGVLSYLNEHGELNTNRPTQAGTDGTTEVLANLKTETDTGELDAARTQPSQDARTASATAAWDVGPTQPIDPVSSFTPFARQVNYWPNSVAYAHPQVFVPDIVPPIPGVS